VKKIRIILRSSFSWHSSCYIINVDEDKRRDPPKGGWFVEPLFPPAIPPDMEIIMKAMTMYRPNTIQNALSDFDRYFESFFGDSILAPAARMLNQLPAVDIKETENAYLLDMDLPGYDESNIEVHVDGSSLNITSKQEERDEKKGKDEENG
jgi:hypothetical protein